MLQFSLALDSHYYKTDLIVCKRITIGWSSTLAEHLLGIAFIQSWREKYLYKQNRNAPTVFLGWFPPPSQASFIISSIFRNWYWGWCTYWMLSLVCLSWKTLWSWRYSRSKGLLLAKARDRSDHFSVSLAKSLFFNCSSLAIPSCLSHFCFKRHCKV